MIIYSIWVKTVENVQELASCILQAEVYKLQPYLIELIASHNESANKNKQFGFTFTLYGQL